MSTQLQTLPVELNAARYRVSSLDEGFIMRLIEDAKTAHRLVALIEPAQFPDQHLPDGSDNPDWLTLKHSLKPVELAPFERDH